ITEGRWYAEVFGGAFEILCKAAQVECHRQDTTSLIVYLLIVRVGHSGGDFKRNTGDISANKLEVCGRIKPWADIHLVGLLGIFVGIDEEEVVFLPADEDIFFWWGAGPTALRRRASGQVNVVEAMVNGHGLTLAEVESRHPNKLWGLSLL